MLIICWRNSWLRDGFKLLVEPIFIFHGWGSVAFVCERAANYQAAILWSGFENYTMEIPRGQWVKRKRIGRPIGEFIPRLPFNMHHCCLYDWQNGRRRLTSLTQMPRKQSLTPAGKNSIPQLSLVDDVNMHWIPKTALWDLITHQHRLYGIRIHVHPRPT